MDARLRRALPRARVASYASTGSEAFVSRDGRTTFALAYPTPDADSTFGENTAAEKRRARCSWVPGWAAHRST